MEFKEFISSLKQEVNSILNRDGWSIAYELKEIGSNYIILKLRDELLETIPELREYDISPTIEIITFKEIFKKQKEIEPEANKHKWYYEGRVKLEMESIFHETSRIVFICKLAQNKNYSYVDVVHIKNFYSIKNIVLNDIKGAKEIYFLGENGDGKSLILMGVHLAFNSMYIQNNTSLEFTGKVQDMLRANKKIELTSKDTNGTKYGNEINVYLKSFYCYGAQRGRYSSDKFDKYGFMSLYDDDILLYSPERLLQQTYLYELEKRHEPKDKDPRSKELPNRLSLKSLKNLFYELLEKNVQIDVSADGVVFTEKGFELSFYQLSEGYKNILIWISDLIYRLQTDQPDIDNLHEFKGVVLLDEIELHLHPIWQSKLVEQVRSIFPNIQFFFTTHSPAIIQGASDDAIIYRVFRDSKTGKTKVSEPYYKKNLDHLMFNTLVTSPLFGLTDARISKTEEPPDTSDSYLQSRIAKRIAEELKNQKAQGKEFLSDKEIDSLIDDILKDELKG